MFFITGSESLPLGYDMLICGKLKSRVRPGFLEGDKQSVYDDEVRDIYLVYSMVNYSSRIWPGLCVGVIRCPVPRQAD